MGELENWIQLALPHRVPLFLRRGGRLGVLPALRDGRRQPRLRRDDLRVARLQLCVARRGEAAQVAFCESKLCNQIFP
jgi:hypothetical protein